MASSRGSSRARGTTKKRPAASGTPKAKKQALPRKDDSSSRGCEGGVRKRPAAAGLRRRASSSGRRAALKRPAAQAAEAGISADRIQDDLNSRGFGMIFLEKVGRRARFTYASVLNKDHFMLPVEVVGPACDSAAEMTEMCLTWTGGDTSLADALWEQFITPYSIAAERLIRRQEYRNAFAEMLSLLIFMRGGDTWLRDQEVIYDWRVFNGFFRRASFAWRALLEQSDAELGLTLAAGQPDCYRERLARLVADWETETNALLEDFDDYISQMGHPGPMRLEIFSPNLHGGGPI